MESDEEEEEIQQVQKVLRTSPVSSNPPPAPLQTRMGCPYIILRHRFLSHSLSLVLSPVSVAFLLSLCHECICWLAIAGFDMPSLLPVEYSMK